MYMYMYNRNHVSMSPMLKCTDQHMQQVVAAVCQHLHVRWASSPALIYPVWKERREAWQRSTIILTHHDMRKAPVCIAGNCKEKQNRLLVLMYSIYMYVCIEYHGLPKLCTKKQALCICISIMMPVSKKDKIYLTQCGDLHQYMYMYKLYLSSSQHD